MKVAITTRPIRAALPVGRAALTDILARIEAIKARPSAWGVTDSLRASLLAAYSVEAVFNLDLYREGFIQGGSPAVLPGWAYSRAGSATATAADGRIVDFGADEPQLTDNGLLIEAAGTNLILHSEAFDNAIWVKSGVTVTADAAVAPDGTMTADKLVESTGSGFHAVYQVITSDAPAAVFAVYAKPAGRDWIGVQIGAAFAYFHLAGAGEVGGTSGVDRARITPVAEGYYRCEVADIPSNDERLVFLATGDGGGSYTGDGASGAYVWGAQAEDAMLRSSYIPTGAATATRAAASADIVVTLPESYTIVGQIVVPQQETDFPGVIGIEGGDDIFLISATGRMALNAGGGLINGGFGPETNPAGSTVRFAVRFSPADTAGAAGGVLSDFGTAITPKQGERTLTIGRLSNNTGHLGSLIKSLLVIPHGLTDAELEAVTT